MLRHSRSIEHLSAPEIVWVEVDGAMAVRLVVLHLPVIDTEL